MFHFIEIFAEYFFIFTRVLLVDQIFLVLTETSFSERRKMYTRIQWLRLNSFFYDHFLRACSPFKVTFCTFGVFSKGTVFLEKFIGQKIGQDRSQNLFFLHLQKFFAAQLENMQIYLKGNMANLSRLGPKQNKILKYFFVILDRMEKSRKTISRDSLFKRRNRPGPGSKKLQILLQQKENFKNWISTTTFVFVFAVCEKGRSEFILYKREELTHNGFALFMQNIYFYRKEHFSNLFRK
jgi:hypothetical protein